jgi:hypothetical protein
MREKSGRREPERSEDEKEWQCKKPRETIGRRGHPFRRDLNFLAPNLFRSYSFRLHSKVDKSTYGEDRIRFRSDVSSKGPPRREGERGRERRKDELPCLGHSSYPSRLFLATLAPSLRALVRVSLLASPRRTLPRSLPGRWKDDMYILVVLPFRVEILLFVEGGSLPFPRAGR